MIVRVCGVCMGMMRQSDNLRKQGGFTLVELALVLIIFAFIFLPLIAVIVQIDLDKKAKMNLDRNDRAVAAINFYLKRHGHYPCPAGPALGPEDPNFGTEARVGDFCDDTVISDDDGVYTGALPTKALDLPFHAAVNTHGWKHFYAVTQELTREGDFNGTGVIEVAYDPGAVAVTTGGVHFIVVNPGKDGKGARSLYGDSGLACGSTALDSANCDNNSLFLDLALVTERSSPTDADYYDDALAYHVVSHRNDFWVPREGGRGRIEIMNRVMGNVGFGVPNPERKLEVGGNALVEGAGPTSGTVTSNAGVRVGGSLLSQEIEVMDFAGLVQSKRFCTGQAYGRGGCCPAGDRIYFDSSLSEMCGTDCASGQVYDGAVCCTKADFDAVSASCL